MDDPAEWSAFGRPLAGAPDGRWESYLALTGIHCAACSLTIEQALAACPGVRQVQVNGATRSARLVWAPGAGARPSHWLAALRRAGYGGLPAGDLLDAAPRRREQRLLLWRWLVAGFCMMQVMMYATPAYLAAPGEITPDMQALLRWASWLLTLPVLLFSCRPFFASAARDLRQGRLGMDVPVALGIAIAFGASSAATFDPHGPLGAEVWFDSVTMFVFFLLSGRLLEQRLRDRTAGALEALVRQLPATVERVRDDGTPERVALRRLAVGERIRVRAGEVLPADGTVLEGESQVDEALLTGESRPLARGPGDAVVAGSHNLAGTLLLRVERLGEQTRFAEIVALMERASVDKPRLARLADRIASPFLLAVLLAAAGAAWLAWSDGPAQALGIAVAVLIVTCPCALSLATPAASLAAAGALARRGVLVRRLDALEAGARIDTVLFDKTGTLTEDRMGVTAVATSPRIDAALALQLAAAAAQHSLHPASRALARAAGSTGWRASEVQEVPGSGVRPASPAWAAAAARLRWARRSSAARRRRTTRHAQVTWRTSRLAGQLRRWTRPCATARSVDRRLQRAACRCNCCRATSRGGAAAGRARRHRRGARRQSPQDKLDAAAGAAAAGPRRHGGRRPERRPGAGARRRLHRDGPGGAVAQAAADVVVPGGQLDAVALLLLQARRTGAWCAGTCVGGGLQRGCACAGAGRLAARFCWPGSAYGVPVRSRWCSIRAPVGAAPGPLMDILFLLIPSLSWRSRCCAGRARGPCGAASSRRWTPMAERHLCSRLICIKPGPPAAPGHLEASSKRCSMKRTPAAPPARLPRIGRCGSSRSWPWCGAWSGMLVGVFIAAQLAWPELNFRHPLAQLRRPAPAAHQRGDLRLRRLRADGHQLLRWCSAPARCRCSCRSWRLPLLGPGRR
jgi:Cu2+-exporting ATPase